MRCILARLTLRVITEGVAGRARLGDVGSGGVGKPAVLLRRGACLGLDRGVGEGEGSTWYCCKISKIRDGHIVMLLHQGQAIWCC